MYMLVCSKNNCVFFSMHNTTELLIKLFICIFILFLFSFYWVVFVNSVLCVCTVHWFIFHIDFTAPGICIKQMVTNWWNCIKCMNVYAHYYTKSACVRDARTLFYERVYTKSELKAQTFIRVINLLLLCEQQFSIVK